MTVGDRVWVHPGTIGGKKNVEGQILAERKEPRSFDVQLKSGSVLRRNREEFTAAAERQGDSEKPGYTDSEQKHGSLKTAEKASREVRETDLSTGASVSPTTAVQVTSSGRQSRPPKYLSDYIWSKT